MPFAKHELTCIFFPDIQPWEIEGIRPVLSALGKVCTVREVNPSQPVPASSDAVWVLARDWKKALETLRLKSGPQVFVSVFGIPPESRNLFTLLWRKLRPNSYSKVKVLAHSPINFRFFAELEGLRRDQVSYLPLCAAPQSSVTKPPSKKAPLIGAFGRFEEQSNLNFVLNIAHYVSRKRPEARFRILGSGPLHRHLSKLIVELGLEENVTLVETIRCDEIASLDIMLYAPLRNDHFLPLLFGAAAGAAAVCTELPGIETLVQDGKSGFVVPVNETRPMGELVIRLFDNPELRCAMAKEFQDHIFSKLDSDKIAQQYEQSFFGSPTESIAQAA